MAAVILPNGSFALNIFLIVEVLDALPRRGKDTYAYNCGGKVKELISDGIEKEVKRSGFRSADLLCPVHTPTVILSLYLHCHRDRNQELV